MPQLLKRTWKSRDIQTERPLSWCRFCGSELYIGMKQDGLCSHCRKNNRKKRGRST